MVGAMQPDLVADVAVVRRPAAVAATRAATFHLPVGPWAAEPPRGPLGHLGLLVLDGLLSREVYVGHRSCVELLGSGDLLRPWDALTDDSSIALDTRWTVQSEVRIAILDRDLAVRISPFPEVVAALMARLARRSRWLAFHLAISHLPRLDVRLRVMFWYMGDRWGRVTPEGVVVPLHLSHALIGELVGVGRSPVTRALGRLRAAGDVTRRPDGSWLLRGQPPSELLEIHIHASGGAGAPAR